jgi:hypothetical protein
MNSAPDQSARQKLAELRALLFSQPFDGCRLVHYAGLGTPNAVDVELSEVEAQVAGCLSEGFRVEWKVHGKRLYLCVQEPDCPIPPWGKVFSEEAAVDEAEILRAAGFKDAT